MGMIVITGAARGIGAACARALAGRAPLLIADLRSDALEQERSRIEDHVEITCEHLLIVLGDVQPDLCVLWIQTEGGVHEVFEPICRRRQVPFGRTRSVAVGAATFVYPDTAEKVAVGLRNYCRNKGISDIRELIGCLR